jgi:hypothetical protein
MKLAKMLEKIAEPLAVWPVLADNSHIRPNCDPDTGEEIPKEKLLHGWAQKWFKRPEYQAALKRLNFDAQANLHRDIKEFTDGNIDWPLQISIRTFIEAFQPIETYELRTKKGGYVGVKHGLHYNSSTGLNSIVTEHGEKVPIEQGTMIWIRKKQ